MHICTTNHYDKLRAGRRQADEHFGNRQIAISTNKRAAVSANDRVMREKSRKLSVEGYQRAMKGEDEVKVMADRQDWRELWKNNHELGQQTLRVCVMVEPQPVVGLNKRGRRGLRYMGRSRKGRGSY